MSSVCPVPPGPAGAGVVDVRTIRTAVGASAPVRPSPCRAGPRRRPSAARGHRSHTPGSASAPRHDRAPLRQAAMVRHETTDIARRFWPISPKSMTCGSIPPFGHFCLCDVTGEPPGMEMLKRPLPFDERLSTNSSRRGFRPAQTVPWRVLIREGGMQFTGAKSRQCRPLSSDSVLIIDEHGSSACRRSLNGRWTSSNCSRARAGRSPCRTFRDC